MKLHLQALLSTVALAAVLVAPAHAVEVTQTNILSDADRLVSYRHQRHLFVTADGRQHLLANLGTQGGAKAALFLRSSADGLVWTAQHKLGYTDSNSVSDVALVGNLLTVVYQGSDGFVRLATATYDPASLSWSSFTVEKVPRAGRTFTAVNPSFTVDANGNTWVAYVQEDSSTGNAGIVLYRKSASKGTWASAQQFFGANDSTYPFGADKRSARLVTLPSGIGMLYSVGPTIYWQERPLKGGADLAWGAAATLLPGTPDKDLMSSHFSTVVDAAGNLFAAFTDNGLLYVDRRDATTGQWYAAPQLVLGTGSSSAKPTYAQLMSLGSDRIGIATNVGYNIWVLQAKTTANAGWKCTDQGTHASFDPTLYSFEHPRVEAPAFPGATVPVLQQFTSADGSLQYAATFSVTPGAPTGCSN
ncbi:hypothetical protein KGA65_05615 [Ideonella sp. B7]|uniref:hypothetical protein n=1 Tax=Ideonella benzenivorans TaxID=2831643 RepID=UPI001CED5E1F|nr:hypothetical protein [Ideonella benzenivorans]MCA6216021.1 hypothetical protein [Ideonella benzenivorans]